MDLPLSGEGGLNDLRGHEEINCRVCIESKQESLIDIRSQSQSTLTHTHSHPQSTLTHTPLELEFRSVPCLTIQHTDRYELSLHAARQVRALPTLRYHRLHLSFAECFP